MIDGLHFANSVAVGGFEWTGDFTTVDLIAASTNALNGALLARRPDHYKQFTVVGIILMAILGGLGGGITRDVLVGEVPSALTNPAYILLAVTFGFIGYKIAYAGGQLFREGIFQFMTAFSLPWYAIVGAQKGVNVGLPVLGCLFLAVVGPTAGRYLIDVTSGVTPKQFIRGEWFVGTAVITGAVWIAIYWAGASTWWAMGTAFVVGFTFRVFALYRDWEEPLPVGPAGVVIHPEQRPLLGRKLHGKSQQELRDLGLLTEDQGQPPSGTGDLSTAGPTGPAAAATTPPGGGKVLLTLILVAAVANLNLSVANVALPSIGAAFDSSQTVLNLIAVGYSLGLAASVLYLGAVGDRYGRKMMLLIGVSLAIPASLLAAYAPSDEILFLARLIGGVSAGMAYPTTLALITALWSGPARTKSIALWSGSGGAIASLGPLVAGALLLQFWWGSVFLITLPLAAVALFMAYRLVPSHVNETTEPVDNLGGILSIVLVSSLILAINFAPVQGEATLVFSLAIVAITSGAAFVMRQRRAQSPLYDLDIARRRIFWVAAVAGIIVFGSLMGAMFIGQQFLQNVLGYSTLEAGASILPAALLMVIVAPRSAKLVEHNGARATLLLGYLFCLFGFLTMLLLWGEGSQYWQVGLGYALLGIGVGFAGTPASHSLTGSVPVKRAGMASGTADLQRDLGGAIMQSTFGALLTAGYATAFVAAIGSSPEQAQVTSSVQSQLTKSFASAEAVAAQYPQYATEITAAAKESFLQGDQWAYLAGIVAVLLGAAVVSILFPKKEEEEALLARYATEDAAV